MFLFLNRALFALLVSFFYFFNISYSMDVLSSQLVTGRNDEGSLAVHSTNCSKVVKGYTAASANVTVPLCNNHSSRLHIAARGYGNRAVQLVRGLIADGADVNSIDCVKRTPLHCCVSRLNFHRETRAVMRELLANGANPLALDDNGVTPIDILTARGHIRHSRWLGEHIRRVYDLGRVTQSQARWLDKIPADIRQLIGDFVCKSDR